MATMDRLDMGALDPGEPSTHYVPFPGFASWPRLVDNALYRRFAQILEDTRKSVNSDDLERAIRSATRTAAIDTGAIEGLYSVDRGFTKTIALETEAWQAALGAREPVVKRSFEDALAAYEFVLDGATGRTTISEAWIRELHRIICRSQDTYQVHTPHGVQLRDLPKGQYKEMPNSPTSVTTGVVHHYAPPHDVPAEMRRLVEELCSSEFATAPPVAKASYAHYAFVCIHPFPDGNGRVSRALASAFLYQSPGVPLVIFADQKDSYIDALEEADSSNYEAFARFISERVIDTIQLVQLRIRHNSIPPAEVSLKRLGVLETARSGLTIRELEAIRDRLLAHAIQALRDRFSELQLPKSVDTHLQMSSNPLMTVPKGYVGNAGDRVQHLMILVTNRPPIHAAVEVNLAFFRAKWDTDEADFVGVATGGVEDRIDISLRLVHPTESAVFQLSMSTWAGKLADAIVAALVYQVETILRSNGSISSALPGDSDPS